MEPQEKELYMKATGRIILNILNRHNVQTETEFWTCYSLFQGESLSVMHELILDIKYIFLYVDTNISQTIIVRWKERSPGQEKTKNPRSKSQRHLNHHRAAPKVKQSRGVKANSQSLPQFQLSKKSRPQQELP